MIKRNMCQKLRVHNRKSYIMTHSLRMSRCLEADTKPRDIESDRFAPETNVLLTLLAEAEHVVNSRLLTQVVIKPEGSEPLTPNHLLILRSGDHSVGVFDRRDNFVRRNWQQVQYLSELFWKRWRREYLQTLQSSQK